MAVRVGFEDFVDCGKVEEPERLRLVGCPFECAPRHDLGEVEERPGGSGDGDPARLRRLERRK